jgi:SAM-dependent methyltransferase
MKLPKRWGHPLISLIPRIKGALLEIGAGDGSSQEILESYGFTWIGLDIRDDERISVNGDAHNLPFKDCSFDGIFTLATLEHLHDPWKAVSEMNRVLKEGGFLIGSVAFLEPYHGSYFHFSHLGLASILKDRGFEIVHLSAGWHVLESLNKGLLKLPIGHFCHLCAFLIMKLRRLFIRIHISLEGTEDLPKAIKFLEEEDYRFAGSLIFKAVKAGKVAK